MNNRKVPRATLQRYPIYLKALRKLQARGETNVISSRLEEMTQIKSTTIRRDFSFIGSLGTTGTGYSVEKLVQRFSEELGIGFDEKIILIGAGNLGKAILNYNNWDNVVGEIVCAFDVAPESVHGATIPVYDFKALGEYIPKGCEIAILCISKDIQETVNTLAEHGIKGIVDFTHEHFIAPEGVIVKPVDVVSSIQEIVFETNNLKK